MEFLGKDINERNHCSLTSCKLNIFLPKSSWGWRLVQVSQTSPHPKGSQFTSLLVGSGEVVCSASLLSRILPKCPPLRTPSTTDASLTTSIHMPSLLSASSLKFSSSLSPLFPKLLSFFTRRVSKMCLYWGWQLEECAAWYSYTKEREVRLHRGH